MQALMNEIEQAEEKEINIINEVQETLPFESYLVEKPKEPTIKKALTMRLMENEKRMKSKDDFNKYLEKFAPKSKKKMDDLKAIRRQKILEKMHREKAAENEKWQKIKKEQEMFIYMDRINDYETIDIPDMERR